MKMEMMMIKTYTLIAMIILLSMLTNADILDTDFDGVPDNQDNCPDTPFLNEVNAKGCTTSILTLPNETDQQDMILSLGYGYSTNEDLKNREIQHNSNIQLDYYINNWNFSLHSGYYNHQDHDGLLDTTLKVKKRIPLNTTLILGLSTGIRLPTHDYKGNKVDYLLSITLHYYATNALSLFGGYGYDYIGDHDQQVELSENQYDNLEEYNSIFSNEEKYVQIEKIQNQHQFHLGIGYFFTYDIYANLVYTEQKSKFKSEHKSASLSSTLYYKINQQWFSTLFYKREILDEDLHDTLLFKIGYHFW